MTVLVIGWKAQLGVYNDWNLFAMAAVPISLLVWRNVFSVIGAEPRAVADRGDDRRVLRAFVLVGDRQSLVIAVTNPVMPDEMASPVAVSRVGRLFG